MPSYSVTTSNLNRLAASFVSDVNSVAVGTGTSTASVDDTALDSQIYEATVAEDVVSVTTTDTDGELSVAIVVVGGTSVPADTDITELGVFDEDDTLLYREVTNPRSVGSGQSIQIETDLRIEPTTN